MALVVRTLITPLGSNKGKFTISLHGVSDSWIPALQNQGDVWQRIGQAGSGVQIVGTRGRQVNATGWSGCADNATAIALIGQFESLETEVCTITDAWARVLARVRLSGTSARPVTTRGPVIAGTSFVKVRVECAWTAELLPNG